MSKQNLKEPLNAEVTTYRNGYKQIGDIHRHDCAEFGLCRAGNGVFFVGERLKPFYKGYVTYMPPDLPHIAQSPAQTPSDWVFLFADVSGFDKTLLPTDGIALFDAKSATLLSLLLEAAEEEKPNEAYYTSVLQALLVRLKELQTSGGPKGEPFCYKQVLPAINYIAKEYHREVTVTELAELCHMSPSLFFRSFKEGIGMPPIAYLHAVRVKVAEALLCATNESIETVAHTVGYTATSSFYRQFTEKHSVSPRKYRTLHRGLQA